MRRLDLVASGGVPFGGFAVPPGGVSGQVLEQVCAGGLEFFADEAQPEEPAPEGVGGVVGDRAGRARCAYAEGLEAHGRAKLDVGLDLARVHGAVEGPELDGAFLPHRVEVEQVVAAGVVVGVCVVGPVGVVVPNPRELLGGLGLLPVQPGEEVLVDLLAPAAPALRGNLEAVGQQVLVCVDQVDQVPERGRGVVPEADVHVDSAGGVCLGARGPEAAKELLQGLDVFPAEDGADQFAPLDVGRGFDAGVALEFPLAALLVEAGVGVVGAAFVAGGRAEEVGGQLGGVLAGEHHLVLVPDGLVFHAGGHREAPFAARRLFPPAARRGAVPRGVTH